MPATATSHKFFEAKARLAGKVGAGGVASAVATTIPHNFVGLTNGNAYIVTVNRTDATGTTKNPANQTETFVGVVSSGNFINCVRQVEGVAQAWAADTVLEILVTAYGWNKFIEGLDAEHNADGTHKNTILALLGGTQEFTGTKIFNGMEINDSDDSHQYVLAVSNLGADRTITLPLLTANDEFVFKEFAQAFKNKTILDVTNVVEEITTTASSSTPTPTGGSLRNVLYVTALAANATFGAPSGTPANGNKLIIRIKDNGTTRTLAYNAIYRAIGVTLPTSTTANKTIYLGFVYNSADSKWDCVAVAKEA